MEGRNCVAPDFDGAGVTEDIAQMSWGVAASSSQATASGIACGPSQAIEHSSAGARTSFVAGMVHHFERKVVDSHPSVKASVFDETMHGEPLAQHAEGHGKRDDVATSPPSASPVMLCMGDARSASAFAQHMGFGVLAHILLSDAQDSPTRDHVGAKRCDSRKAVGHAARGDAQQRREVRPDSEEGIAAQRHTVSQDPEEGIEAPRHGAGHDTEEGIAAQQHAVCQDSEDGIAAQRNAEHLRRRAPAATPRSTQMSALAASLPLGWELRESRTQPGTFSFAGAARSGPHRRAASTRAAAAKPAKPFGVSGAVGSGS